MEKSSLVKVYLKAESEDAIIVAMAKNNAKHGCFFNYGDPLPMLDKKTWITWYYVDIRKIRRRSNK